MKGKILRNSENTHWEFLIRYLKNSLFELCLSFLLIFLIGCTAKPSQSVPTEILKTQIAEPLPTQIPSAYTPESPGNLSENQISTLSSLRLVNDYPLYIMNYQGVLPGTNNSTQANGPTEIDWACSLFASLGDEEDQRFGRNFDWEFSPGLLLFTDPPDGYASASMVDLTYLGFEAEDLGQLNELELAELTALLDAPNWPFDGMNEAGLAIGMAAVPDGKMNSYPQKPNIGSIEVMRMVLDNAANVREATAIMESYNIDFRGGPDLHYLIADRSGEAALVEFFEGEMHIIPNDKPWHMATNFIISSVNDPKGQGSRYDRLSTAIQDTGGNLKSLDAKNLLSNVSQSNTQWSVLYNLDNGAIEVIMGRRFDQTHKFQLIP